MGAVLGVGPCCAGLLSASHVPARFRELGMRVPSEHCLEWGQLVWGQPVRAAKAPVAWADGLQRGCCLCSAGRGPRCLRCGSFHDPDLGYVLVARRPQEECKGWWAAPQGQRCPML